MSRRGRGEGSIYKRKDGRWAGAVSLPNGRQKTVYAGTRTAVREKLRQTQQQVAQGLPVADEQTRLADYLRRWLEDSARQRLRPRVFASYKQVVEGHLIPALGGVRLAKLTPAAIQQYMNEKLGAGLAPNTIKNHHSILRRALGQAERWGMVPRNVARLVSPPRVPRAEVTPLTPDQARVFLDSCTGDRIEALYVLALSLGLRQGEVLGLTWDDIDFESGEVRVRMQLQRYSGAYHLDEVKTDRSRRTISIPDEIVATMRSHRVRQAEERLRAGPLWEGDDWNLVFCTERGRPIYGAAHLAVAGLPRQRFHDLRHGAASFMIAAGVPLRVVQEVLGHSTIAVTADIYGHVLPEATRDATSRVVALLRTGA